MLFRNEAHKNMSVRNFMPSTIDSTKFFDEPNIYEVQNQNISNGNTGLAGMP